MAPNGIPYPMVSDPGGKIGAEYGVYDEAKGADVRGRFLIDPDGIVEPYTVPADRISRTKTPRRKGRTSISPLTGVSTFRFACYLVGAPLAARNPF